MSDKVPMTFEEWCSDIFIPQEVALRSAYQAGQNSMREDWDRLIAEVAEWKKAIEGLTPSGSEFVNDPKACAAWIRKRTNWPAIIIKDRQEHSALIEQCRALAEKWPDPSEPWAMHVETLNVLNKCKQQLLALLPESASKESVKTKGGEDGEIS